MSQGDFLSGGVPFNSGTDAIIIAGSDAPQSVKNQANYTCTGTNDDAVFNAAVMAVKASALALATYTAAPLAIIRARGTFNPSQMMLLENVQLDARGAVFNTSSWAAGGRSLFQVGGNHVCNFTASLTSGSGSAVKCTGVANGCANVNGNQVYLIGSSLPAGMNETTAYKIVNYTGTSFGNATWNLALWSDATDTPITSTSAGSGTNSLVQWVGTYSSSTNELTIAGASPLQLAKGQPIYISTGLPTGLNPSGSNPYFWVVPQGSNVYKLYLDPSLTLQATSASSGTCGGCLVATGLGIWGGTINVNAGSTLTTLGVIKDNVSTYGSIYDGITTNVDPSVGGGTVNVSHYYLDGFGTKVRGCVMNGGNMWGAGLVGGQISVNDCEINGALGGAIVRVGIGSANGCKIVDNHIRNCQGNGIQVATSSQISTEISGNVLDGNCSASGTAEILDFGTGTLVGINQFINMRTNVGPVSMQGTGGILTPFTVASYANKNRGLAMPGIIAYTPPSDTPFQGYELSGGMRVSLLDSGGTINVQAVFTDTQATSQTMTLTAQSPAGSMVTQMNNAADYYSFVPLPLYVETGHPITININCPGDEGDSTYDPFLKLERIF